MGRIIIATIVTHEVVEKEYTVEDGSINLASFLCDCIHRDYGHELDIKGIDYDSNKIRIMFPDYYCDPQQITWSEKYPFIITNNKVEWNVPFEEVTVNDFVRTHNIKEDDPIKVNIGGGIGGMGGDLLPLADWISILISFVDVFKDNIEFSASVITIMLAFRGRDGLYIDPREARTFFRTRKQWDSHRFEESVGISCGPEFESIMGYSEFKKNGDSYVRQDCSDDKHLDIINLNNQKIWGQFIFDDIVDDVAALLYDINRTITEIQVLSQELKSDSFEISRDILDRFLRKWESSVQKGDHFQFLQLKTDSADVDDYEQFEKDLYDLIETLNSIKMYLIKKLES